VPTTDTTGAHARLPHSHAAVRARVSAQPGRAARKGTACSALGATRSEPQADAGVPARGSLQQYYLGMFDPPQVVLVHGGFLGAWSWTDVAACLESWGFAAVSLELASMGTPPLGDLHSDAGCVRAILDRLTAPAVLCGHSYGGAVITEAAAGPHPMVGQLVYLAGAVPDTGQSMADLAPLASPDSDPEVSGEQIIARPDGSIVLSPASAVASLSHDCTPARAQAAVDQLRPMNPVVSTQAVTGAAWRDLPATFVRCTADRLPELICNEFLHRSPQVVEFPTGHCPNWSQPQLVAALLGAQVEQVAA
jgi:pimeloyl-ACP methyl ester carboxylesterase